jgi:hypothetical protein
MAPFDVIDDAIDQLPRNLKSGILKGTQRGEMPRRDGKVGFNAIGVRPDISKPAVVV